MQFSCYCSCTRGVLVNLFALWEFVLTTNTYIALNCRSNAIAAHMHKRQNGVIKMCSVLSQIYINCAISRCLCAWVHFLFETFTFGTVKLATISYLKHFLNYSNLSYGGNLIVLLILLQNWSFLYKMLPLV